VKPTKNDGLSKGQEVNDKLWNEYATAALTGLVAQGATPEQSAQRAIEYADAMVKAVGARQPPARLEGVQATCDFCKKTFTARSPGYLARLKAGKTVDCQDCLRAKAAKGAAGAF